MRERETHSTLVLNSLNLTTQKLYASRRRPQPHVCCEGKSLQEERERKREERKVR